MALLRELSCCPTSTTKLRVTAATRTIPSCCPCWRAAVNLTHGSWLNLQMKDALISKEMTQLWYAEVVWIVSLTVWAPFRLGLCPTGCTVACFETFTENSWSRSTRITSVLEVRCLTHMKTNKQKNTKEEPARQTVSSRRKKADLIWSFIA